MEQSRGAGGAERSIEAVWRVESARVIAALGRISGDVGAAEDLAHDALLAALQQWPVSGLPASPFSWLVTVGRRRFIDGLRRSARAGTRDQQMLRQAEQAESASGDQLEAATMEPGDDLLRLMFACCHPVLSDEARVALTLKLLGGLSTEQIARATLEREPTVAQRIVRAKRTLRATGVRLELPPPSELRSRVESVLSVIYLIFNEGYVATSGNAWTEPTLCREALRLGRVLAELVRDVEEVHGLVALMEIQASRLRARTSPNGEAVLLADQERSRWDRLLIRRGLSALERASSLGRGLGPYGIQAAIAACHATAPSIEATDWARIAALYDALGEIAPSPVVELNRAVAVTMAYGPQAGLAVLDAIADHPQLANYHLALSVRGDLLERLGRFADAESAFRTAAAMTANAQEQLLLSRRADQAGARAIVGSDVASA
jgi:RNA polymerase sigma factor (sigma-70 family)